MSNVHDYFRGFAVDTLTKYENQIVGCLDRLSDQQVWERDNEHVNTIGNLILHLNGNLGQYIVSALGGTPDTRERDAEFNAQGGLSVAELRARLTARLAECKEVIRNVPDSRLPEQVVAQGNLLPVVTIIFKAVEHFALHTGQILLRTKQLTGKELGYSTHNRAASTS